MDKNVISREDLEDELCELDDSVKYWREMADRMRKKSNNLEEGISLAKEFHQQEISTLQAENKALRARVDELERALKPFSDYEHAAGRSVAANTNTSTRDDMVFYSFEDARGQVELTLGDFTRARQALKGKDT